MIITVLLYLMIITVLLYLMIITVLLYLMIINVLLNLIIISHISDDWLLIKSVWIWMIIIKIWNNQVFNYSKSSFLIYLYVNRCFSNFLSPFKPFPDDISPSTSIFACFIYLVSTREELTAFLKLYISAELASFMN
jgi:hypothetical protein